MSSKTPRLEEVLEAAIGGVLDDVRVALPGRIESYDADSRRATVQCLVMDRFVDEDGNLQAAPMAPWTDVPVALAGSGTVRIKFPIRAGDPCWVMFASSSIARCKAGDGTTVVDPGDDRHHHLADAFAIPIPTMAATGADDAAMIEFTDSGLIKAGGDEPLVTRSEFNAHTHTVATTGTAAAQTGTAAIPAPITGTPRLRG